MAFILLLTMAKSAEGLLVRMQGDEEQTILIVDDSEDDALLMRLAFARAEFSANLQIVPDGEDAVAYLEGQFPYSDRGRFPLPTLILLDLNMPRKNGFEVMEWLRAQPEFRHLPIIVLTSSMRGSDVEKAFELGATSFFVKPGRVDDLVSMIRCMRAWLHFSHFPRVGGAARDGQDAVLDAH